MELRENITKQMNNDSVFCHGICSTLRSEANTPSNPFASLQELVQSNNIAYKSLRTSLTLKGMGFYPRGGTHALEGDVSNGTKRRIYPVVED
jgi:hypothetical protein